MHRSIKQECVVHLGRSAHEDPLCSGPVPTAKTTLNPAYDPERKKGLQNEPRLDDPITSEPIMWRPPRRPRREARTSREIVSKPTSSDEGTCIYVTAIEKCFPE